MKVLKRNGSITEFKKEKIVDAIIKAMLETEIGIDEDIAWNISEDIENEFEESDIIPTVESIQDRVEELLAFYKRFEVSRKYILYRENKNKLRKYGWEMTDLQQNIYEKKYRFNNEIFEEFLNRVSGGNEYIKKAIRDKKFMPAGRILAGRKLNEYGRKITLSNCYVVPKVEDNIESIFDTAKYLARTYSYGGGSGLNISKLRPNGAKVNNAASTTTGPVSFMKLYSLVTSIIGMKGRRGALMLNMDVDHPDIEEFINAKNNLNEINTANISVNVTDEFMNAVVNNKKFELKFYVKETEEYIKKEIEAKDLFEKLAYNNWNMAEPGILYQDRINSWHLMSEDKNFEFAGVNPCAEEALPAFGSCNLSSINLSEFVKNPFTDSSEFDFENFSQIVRNGIIYLNEILDENINLHPLKEQREVSKNLRQIGLGIMGLADMFIKMGIKYGSKESIDLINKIGYIMINEALVQSALLAKEYGPFPKYDKDKILESPFLISNAKKETKELIKKYGLRNSQLLTIPPTGTTSALIGCSNGIEPIFRISYTMKTESLDKEDTYYEVFTSIVKEYMNLTGISDKNNLPDYFVTAENLNYKERIDVQAAWQRYIDASISSTVNVPNEFTIDEVYDLYIYAWMKGLKGITIYRDGCARAGVLIDNKKEDKLKKIDELKQEINSLANEALKENPDVCPMCGGKMLHVGGCIECSDCGYSPCSV